jgi:hypothetical protein
LVFLLPFLLTIPILGLDWLVLHWMYWLFF